MSTDSNIMAYPTQVLVAEWLACLTTVREHPGSNHTAGGCVYHNSCYDIQLWVWVGSA